MQRALRGSINTGPGCRKPACLANHRAYLSRAFADGHVLGQIQRSGGYKKGIVAFGFANLGPLFEISHSGCIQWELGIAKPSLHIEVAYQCVVLPSGCSLAEDLVPRMASVYENNTKLGEGSVPDTFAAVKLGKVGVPSAVAVPLQFEEARYDQSTSVYNVLMKMMEQGINAFVQEDVADQVLQQMSSRDKLQMARVCRVWRAWVATSSSTVTLSGPDVQGQMTWLAQRMLPRMLKVTSLVFLSFQYLSTAHATCFSTALCTCRS